MRVKYIVFGYLNIGLFVLCLNFLPNHMVADDTGIMRDCFSGESSIISTVRPIN